MKIQVGSKPKWCHLLQVGMMSPRTILQKIRQGTQLTLVVKSIFYKKLNFGRKGRNDRNDSYPLDGELPAVCALALCFT